ncbi:Teichoic acid translocation ATP-binding protein [Liquorilactobacillus oeni DSM 19972]|uniref:Teichoic acid translocation ATP-binding protein n=2 Tax=Liquorilactobacillus oeni TaxID=303241 RepID=A0A0R1MKX0_9LACO|nr:Teichoic acid translocation ATP-binding protein [Liquorilactobacillus oeni DSM 19972]
MEIKYITKCAPLLPEKKDIVKSKLPVSETKKFWELRGISLNINQGEAIGLLGTNGSGKATLINILAGNEKQTTGFISMDSKLSLASIHTPSDINLTGLENIKQAVFNAKLDEFKANHLINAIINFSELSEWLYRPVKTYSLGLVSRLSLAIALHVSPQLVLIDSLLSIVDLAFFKKVAKRIDALKDKGSSFIIADTNVINIERFCERTMWLQFGQVQDFGPTREVMVQFEYFSSWYQALTLPEKNDFLSDKQRERQNFEVGTVYEEFKVEQFKNGFTRKDEPRMRKAFYKDHGVDPVNSSIKPKKKIQKTQLAKKNYSKFLLIIVVVLLIGAALWVTLDYKGAAEIFERAQSTMIGRKESSSAEKNSSKARKQKSSKNAEAATKTSAQKVSQSRLSSIKTVSESQAKAKSSSESSAKASSESSAKASSESQQKLMDNTQTINVQSGDTLEGLASKYATTIDKIKEINKMNSDSDLRAGDVIRVPK